MLNVTLTSIACALIPIIIKADILTVVTSPAYPIISIGSLIGSLILLAIPGKGCFTRLVKSIIYLSLIAISGFIAYSVLNVSPIGVPIRVSPGFLLPAHHIVAATIFSSLTLPSFSDWVAYTTLVANVLTIITSLVGLAKQFDTTK